MKYLKFILIILVGILVLSFIGGFDDKNSNNKKNNKFDPYDYITTDIFDVTINSTYSLGEKLITFNEDNIYNIDSEGESFGNVVELANYRFNSLSYSLNEVDETSGVTRNVNTYFICNEKFFISVSDIYDDLGRQMDKNRQIYFEENQELTELIDMFYDIAAIYSRMQATNEICYIDLVIEVEDIYKDEVINTYSEVFTLGI